MCDIVLLVYDQLVYTKGCIESILKNTDCPYRLLIIDNGSVKEETLRYLEDLRHSGDARISVFRIPQNIGYVRAVNYGLARTTQEYVCVISNDTIVYPGWLSEMIAAARKDPLIGLVNPLWMVPKRFFGSRDKYFRKVVHKQKGKYIETDWARGFCFLVTRQVIEKIGGLDEAFVPAYFDDWDYSVRAIKAGFRCVCALGAFVWHYKNGTYGLKFSTDSLRQKAKIFYGRWGAPIRILLLDDHGDRLLTADFCSFIRELLNGQNRVLLVSTGKNRKLDGHTNLKYSRIPGFWLRTNIILRLLDNLRNRGSKRYDMIIGPGDLTDFLCSVPVIRTGYSKRFYLYNEKYDNLFTEVDLLKQQKTVGLL